MSKKLRRTFTAFDVFSFSSGAMISSGLFVLPALVADKIGAAAIVAYLLASIMVVPALFAKAELTTAMPKTGGDYFIVYRSLGALLGTFTGFASWFSLSLKSAFALVGIGVFLYPFMPDLQGDTVKIIAIAFTLVFTLINILGSSHSGKFQRVFVILLLTALGVYIVSGFSGLEIQNFSPFMEKPVDQLFLAAGMIFVSFGGLTKVASIAEEVRHPGRNIPRGMFSAFFIVSIIYIFTVFVTIGILSPAGTASTLTPLSDGAAVILGMPGRILLTAAAIFAFFTTGNAGLMAASRIPLAMANDNLIPGFIGIINIKRQTPVISILLTAAFMIISIVLLDLEKLVKVASTMKLILFTLSTLCVILMRESRISSYKPNFHSPLYPFLQIAGVIVYIALIVLMGSIPLLLTFAFFGLSTLWYFVYRKNRTKKESALIHIVERLTAKEIKSSTLSNELRDILREKSGYVEDRFDRLISNTEILDIKEDLNMDQFFKRLGTSLGAILSAEPEQITRQLHEREEESTTVIHEGLAIPHIVVEGESHFTILVARSQKGIVFHPDKPPVHIIFTLAGTKDERNFHLQALMAIAQIVQNPGFLEKWLKCATVHELKNLILIAERVRKGRI